MNSWIPLWLPGATDHARAVDLLFVGLLASSVVVLALLFFLLLRFAIHYRAGNALADRNHRIKKSWHWEVSWTAATFAAFLGLFIWAAHLFVTLQNVPVDALPVYVVAKQWMWKTQHLGGQREINELHVPLGPSIRLIMSSQDVIHSFFIPEFRIKHDVVPGATETLWFKPAKTGVFHLMCSEYCGTDHSRMTGRIVVMEPAAFADWLERQDADGSMSAEGARLFRQFGCSGCHGAGAIVRAPPLEGVYGKPIATSDGGTAVADEAYIRQSILKPRSRVVAGYPAAMPSYEGKITEDELTAISAYIKSLGDATRPAQ